MGLDRIRNTVTTFVWYHLFYFVVLVVFFIGSHLQQCDVFWVDRLYILLAIPVVTALALAVVPGNWWGRFFHLLFTLGLMIFFLVVFFAYLLPAFVTANCQPTGLTIPNVCSGGKCNNPFNDLRWSCLFGNTSEGQLCEYSCVSSLCDTGVAVEELTRRFGHVWIFSFVIVFVVMMLVSLLLLWNLNLLVRRARDELIAGQDGQNSLGEELRQIENIYPYLPGANVYGDPSQPHAHGKAYYETDHDSYLERRPDILGVKSASRRSAVKRR